MRTRALVCVCAILSLSQKLRLIDLEYIFIDLCVWVCVAYFYSYADFQRLLLLFVFRRTRRYRCARSHLAIFIYCFSTCITFLFIHHCEWRRCIHTHTRRARKTNDNNFSRACTTIWKNKQYNRHKHGQQRNNNKKKKNYSKSDAMQIIMI